MNHKAASLWHTVTVVLAVTALGFISQWLQTVSDLAVRHSSVRHIAIGSLAGGFSGLTGWLIGKLS